MRKIKSTKILGALATPSFIATPMPTHALLSILLADGFGMCSSIKLDSPRVLFRMR